MNYFAIKIKCTRYGLSWFDNNFVEFDLNVEKIYGCLEVNIDFEISSGSPADRIMFLQRTIDNQSVEMMIQSGNLHAIVSDWLPVLSMFSRSIG
jgi:hypothetical protein